ncbi:MAG TPA: hypothetical protein VFQ99_04165, partial [Gallionella sp.]|nr:hypothetical protein [Gallionella sp.]
MSLTPFNGTPPQRNDRATFSGRVDAFVTWFINCINEIINTVIPSLNFPGLMATSTTSVAIGTGSKS